MITTDNLEKMRFLGQYKAIDSAINQKCEEVAMWRSRATKITASNSPMCIGGNKDDRIQLAVEKIIEIETEINEEIDALINIKARIIEAIKTIDDINLQNILELRYIKGKTIEKISYDIGYSLRHTKRKHRKAINLLRT